MNFIKNTKEKVNLPRICNNSQTSPPPLPTNDLETKSPAQSTTDAEGQSNDEMNFLLGAIKLIKEKLNLLWICNNPRPTRLQTSLSPTNDLETGYSAQSTTTAEGQFNNAPWLSIGVCVTLIGITVQALQTLELLNSESFHWICMALVFSLTAVMVSIYISGDYKLQSLLAVHIGTFIVFTALVVAFFVNLKLPFKVISVAVYVIGILVIMFAKFCKHNQERTRSKGEGRGKGEGARKRLQQGGRAVRR